MDKEKLEIAEKEIKEAQEAVLDLAEDNEDSKLLASAELALEKAEANIEEAEEE